MNVSTLERTAAPACTGTAGAARGRVTDPADCRAAASALADGAVVGQAFANIYMITTRSDVGTVRRVNIMKGRPPGQVGSITTTPSRIPALWDWSQLPAPLTRRRVLGVMDTFFDLGPFGFRGPAAPHVPPHLTSADAGVTTAQLIAPGYGCPSNAFLARAVEAADDDLLHITSAARSRHLTVSDGSPAHWRADGLRAEFGIDGSAGLTMLEPDDETTARRRYPRHLAMLTTILAFHRVTIGLDGRPALRLERHGSLCVSDVRDILDGLGFGLTIAPGARTRLQLREYDATPAA